MPISRVRSVTETSMMFMMPMPPTSRLTAAMPREQVREHLRRLAERVQEVGLVADLEVVRLALREPCSRRRILWISAIATGMLLLGRREHADRAQPVVPISAVARGLIGDQDLVVGVAEAGAAGPWTRARRSP